MPLYSAHAIADWPAHFPKNDPRFDPNKPQSASPPWRTLNTIDALNYWRKSCQSQLNLHGQDSQAHRILEATLDVVRSLKRSRIRNRNSPAKFVDVFPYEALGMSKKRSLKRKASDDKDSAQREAKRRNIGTAARNDASPTEVVGHLNDYAVVDAEEPEAQYNPSKLESRSVKAAVQVP